MKFKFYHFRQSNPGGFYQSDAEHHYIIQAESADEANRIAEASTPIYFDGCYNGDDCQCCGDRWSRCNEYDASDAPKIYGELIDPLNPVYDGSKVAIIDHPHGHELSKERIDMAIDALMADKLYCHDDIINYLRKVVDND